MIPIFRFAPSPTGLLHLGHALSATCVWRAADEAGGRVLLRIEDIDPVRAKPEFTAAIEEDLAWLGFRWEGEAVRQSARMSLYRAALDRLTAMDLTYKCSLTRSEHAAGVAKAEARDGKRGRAIPTARRACRSKSSASWVVRRQRGCAWRRR